MGAATPAPTLDQALRHARQVVTMLEQLVQEIEPRSPDMCDSVNFFGASKLSLGSMPTMIGYHSTHTGLSFVSTQSFSSGASE